jgi:hypothetical protein
LLGRITAWTSLPARGPDRAYGQPPLSADPPHIMNLHLRVETTGRAGLGARMAFALWSDHGGAPRIASFSIAHQITGAGAWVAALVGGRTGHYGAGRGAGPARHPAPSGPDAAPVPDPQGPAPPGAG